MDPLQTYAAQVLTRPCLSLHMGWPQPSQRLWTSGILRPGCTWEGSGGSPLQKGGTGYRITLNKAKQSHLSWGISHWAADAGKHAVLLAIAIYIKTGWFVDLEAWDPSSFPHPLLSVPASARGWGCSFSLGKRGWPWPGPNRCLKSQPHSLPRTQRPRDCRRYPRLPELRSLGSVSTSHCMCGLFLVLAMTV